MMPNWMTFERKRVEELTAKAAVGDGDKSLPKLDSMDGYADWARHPITKELLARVEYRRGFHGAEAETMAPCASCKKDGDGVDKEARGFAAGIAEAFHAVARCIVADAIPPCDHK